MAEPDAAQRRETRVLIATIGVSITMLLLLARFRFPEESARGTVEPVAAPLERLAARATFDELASSMADLERRIGSRVEVLRTSPERTPGGYVPAPRLTPNRVVMLLIGNEQVVEDAAGGPLVIGRDAARGLAVVAVPPRAEYVVVPRSGPPREGPRYVAVVEATREGPVVRPVYLGRTRVSSDPRLNTPMLVAPAQQQTVPPGAAIFSLEGEFIGLSSNRGGGTVTIIPAESLQAFAQQAAQAPTRPGDLGMDVQALSPALARASGADSGVIVSYVQPQGPAAGLLTSGDVVQAIDGTNVTTVGGYQQLASGSPPGKPVAIKAVRQGVPLEVTVRAVEAGLTQTVIAPQDEPGVTVRAVPGVGLEVVALQPSTPAAAAGLQPGDLIVAIGGRPASDAKALSEAFRGAARGAALLLTIRRGIEHRVVALEKP